MDDPQRKWIGHTLRGDSLLRMVIKEKMEGRQTRQREPRRQVMMMDLFMIGGYGKFEEEVQQ